LKFAFTILLQLITLFLYAQKCDTISGKPINCVDKNNLKQGYWEEESIYKILTTDSFRRNPRAIGLHNDAGKIQTPIAEGFYKNNKRIGEWTYEVGSFYNDNFANPTAHQKLVTFTDSGYFYLVDTFWHYTAKVSNDTSEFKAIVILKNETFEIIFKDRKCYYLDPFKKNKKVKFPYPKLDSYLSFLNFYSYKVKKKTSNK
jgi:hypothetical protein